MHAINDSQLLMRFYTRTFCERWKFPFAAVAQIKREFLRDI